MIDPDAATAALFSLNAANFTVEELQITYDEFGLYAPVSGDDLARCKEYC